MRHVDDVRKGPNLAADVTRAPLTAEVCEVEEAKLGILAALYGQMLDRGICRDRKNRRRGAPEIGIPVVQRLKVRRRVAVQRFAGIDTRASASVGIEVDDRFAPVVIGVINTVAGAHENAVGARIVNHAGTRPDRVARR